MNQPGPEHQSPSARLSATGRDLPEPAQPAYNYVAARVEAGTVHVSGQLPKEDGEVRIVGRVGDEVDLATAQRAAEICCLQGLACAADAVGGLDHVTGVLKVGVFVASAPDFHDQPKVADAASTLLVEVFGEAGRHARSAVGVAALPRRSPVEIEFIFTTHPPNHPATDSQSRPNGVES